MKVLTGVSGMMRAALIRQRSALQQAILCALLMFVLASLAFALGGASWFLPLATLYGLFLFVRRPAGQTARIDLTDVFPTAAGSMVLVLAFAHTEDERLFLPFLVTVSANAAVALGLVAARRRALMLVAAVAGALLPAAAPILVGRQVPVAVVGVGGLLGFLLYVALGRTGLVGRRLVASLACGLLAWFILG